MNVLDVMPNDNILLKNTENKTGIKTSIVIAAFNEEKGLPVVLSKISNIVDESCEVIVVDDGSVDGTAEVTSELNFRLIKHEVNKGKGEALKTGIRNSNGEKIISIDADDTYQAELIPQLIEALDTYDVVIGSRFYGRNNIPPVKRIGNFIISHSIKSIYGFKPHDPLTGLWGVRRCHAIKILPESRYAPDAEMWMKACRMKLKICDIHTTYAPRIGETTLPSLGGGLEHLKLILKLLRWRPAN